ncbi:MAG: two-component regulator propeller domain-containing protein [Bacteroidota bacterium]
MKAFGMIFLAMLGAWGGLRAQTSQIAFRPLSQKDGLSQNIVRAVMQDQYGFMWFGTENGLNRYDGYTFQHFGEDAGFTTANISQVAEAEDGSFWVGTKAGGLYRFFPHIGTANPFQDSSPSSFPSGKDQILRLFVDSDDGLWLSTRNGELRYLPSKQDTFIAIILPRDFAQPRVYDILEDGQGAIWLGTNAGLYQVNKKQGHTFQIKAYHYDASVKNGLSGKIPWHISLGLDGAIWIGCYGSGVDRFNPQDNSWKHYDFADSPGQSLSSNIVNEIMVASNGIVWIGTQDRGLNRLDPSTGRISHFKHEAGNVNHLGGNYVLDLFEDHSGGIWVSTAGSGLNYYNPWRVKFEHYQQQAYSTNSLSNNYVFSLLNSQKDPWRSLWIGTHGGGLNQMIYDSLTQTSRFLHYISDGDDPQSLSDEVVLSLTEDQKGNLWVGTFQGLNLLRPEVRDAYVSGKISKPTFERLGYANGEPEAFTNAFFPSMLCDHQGNVWIGTNRALYCYNAERSSYKRFIHEADQPNSLNSNNLLCLFEDSKHRIWVGSHHGLNAILPTQSFDQEPTILSYIHNPNDRKTLSYSQVYAVHEDYKNRIWVGTTGGGINAFIEDENEEAYFVHFYKTDGLPSNNIEGILSDEEGQLWVSTDDGLCVFHPDSLLAASDPKTQIRTYYISDGLQGSEFNEGAFSKGLNGRLYFGGVEGFNAFHPNQLKDNPYPPEVRLTGLRILDRDIKVGDLRDNGDTLLKQDIGLIEQIELTYRDYGFTLEFAALDFAAPQQNQFAYLLEGLDEKWINTGTRPYASFTNLDAGTYQFRLKASNNDGVWQEMQRPLTIKVSPPPWQTWWAYLIYALLFGGSIYAYFSYRAQEREREIQTKARIEKAKADEREKVRKNTAADFHDELGNKMTKISLFVELAKRAGMADESLQLYLGQVENNTQMLSQGIRDFIWVLDPEKDSIYDTLVRIKDFGDEMFEHTDITFRTAGISPQLSDYKLPLNLRRHLVLIFKEAMNNCLKYAQATEVKFEAFTEGEKMKLGFHDNGIGFDADQIKAGYGLKNIHERAAKIDAEAEVNSELGAGTQIWISLQLPHMSD